MHMTMFPCMCGVVVILTRVNVSSSGDDDCLLSINEERVRNENNHLSSVTQFHQVRSNVTLNVNSGDSALSFTALFCLQKTHIDFTTPDLWPCCIASIISMCYCLHTPIAAHSHTRSNRWTERIEFERKIPMNAMAHNCNLPSNYSA